MRAAVRDWRNAASLLILSPVEASGRCNYEVLLQTRGEGASFRNSVVFPGGVHEPADASGDWLALLKAHGYSQADFERLHRSGTSITPIFESDPLRRHIALRITAIRETFEELGLLVCSRGQKENRDANNIWASVITDFDVKHWQSRVSKDPSELFNLCSELKCYPDIWSLHYWSNWLSPTRLKKRFDTAFFITALQTKPAVRANSEVVKVEWHTPCDVVSRSDQLVIYPPQIYELTLLSQCVDARRLVAAARDPSAPQLYYHATVRATDGTVHVFPGDDLYPASVDYNNHTTIKTNKSVSELRNSSRVLHRIETLNPKTHRLVLKNYKPRNIDMGDIDIPLNVTFS